MKANKAYALLLLFLSDGFLASLQDENIPYKIWNKLERTYDTKRSVNQVFVWKILETIKQDRAVSMRHHIDEINKLILNLKLFRAEMSETETIVYILMS